MNNLINTGVFSLVGNYLRPSNNYRQSSFNIGAPPGVLGIWGEWLFIFRDLGSTGNYFRGSGEQAHSFGDLGSPAKKQKK